MTKTWGAVSARHQSLIAAHGRFPQLYHSQVYATIIASRPLLSINEAWMDECVARSQSLADQYNNLHQQRNFAIRNVLEILSFQPNHVQNIS